MTAKRKTPKGMLRITQVHSRIGNQERVKKVLTDGLSLGRIGSSVVLPDNPYTRGMIAKVVHIVRFEEIAAKDASGDSLPASEGGSGGHPSRAGGRAGEATPRKG